MSVAYEIKAKLPFVDVLSEFVDFDTSRQHVKIKCFNHADDNPSMVVYPDGAYCHVCCRQFDLFDVWMHFKRCDFRRALEDLANRAGVALTNTQQTQAQRVKEDALEAATTYYHNNLNDQAKQYLYARGFTDETIAKARIGYAANDNGLQKYLLSRHIDPTGTGLLSQGGFDFCAHKNGYDLSPDGFIVYPHIHNGRVVYLAGRSITVGVKEHRNLPGGKEPYFNHVYNSRSKEVFIVEGQACAITLAQWGYAAVAICGASISSAMWARIGKHSKLYLVPDSKGTNIEKIINQVGPLVEVVKLAYADINAMLQAGDTQSDFEALKKRAQSYFASFCHDVTFMQGIERDNGIKRAFELLLMVSDPIAQKRLGEIVQNLFDIPKREYNKILKSLSEDGASGKLTEPDIRDLWIGAHPDTLYGLGFWRRCKDGFWQQIDDDTVGREIMETLEAQGESAPIVNQNRVKSVMHLAQLKLGTPAALWDNLEENVLVCRNGVLDLSTMQIRPHKKEYYATTGLDYDYDPGADCPNFMYAVTSAIPDALDFFQEFCGYCLTTQTQFETGIWMYGKAGCGKSTIIEGIKNMLGVKAGLLSLARLETNPRFSLVNVPGKTLLFATESPTDYIQSTETLKRLISGEEVEFERKHKDETKFRPVAKILWAMERLPRVDGGGSDGIFRRVKIIHFPPLEVPPDPFLKQRIAAERAGILNWAIEGLKRLQDRGYFDIPTAVKSATQMWHVVSDKATLFINEWCNLHLQDADCTSNQAKRMQSKELYDNYAEWCAFRGYRPESIHKMHGEWQRVGLIPARIGGPSFWLGVSMKVTQERQEYGF